MDEKDNLMTDESSEEEANRALFCGMASVDSSESDCEVLFISYLANLKACVINSTRVLPLLILDLEKQLAFYESETRLLTEENDKLFKEQTSLFESFRFEKKTLNEKIASLEKSLKDKTAEVRDIMHENSNDVSLTKFFKKEREFLHQDLLDRELKIRKFQDAPNVYNRIRVEQKRTWIL